MSSRCAHSLRLCLHSRVLRRWAGRDSLPVKKYVPRFHLLRYHGVLAAHAKDRSQVVPGPKPDEGENLQLRFWDDEPAATQSSGLPTSPATAGRDLFSIAFA